MLFAPKLATAVTATTATIKDRSLIPLSADCLSMRCALTRPFARSKWSSFWSHSWGLFPAFYLHSWVMVSQFYPSLSHPDLSSRAESVTPSHPSPLDGDASCVGMSRTMKWNHKAQSQVYGREDCPCGFQMSTQVGVFWRKRPLGKRSPDTLRRQTLWSVVTMSRGTHAWQALWCVHLD